MIEGVDISKYNPVNDWKKLKNNTDFVIIKLGGKNKNGLYIDRNFESNFKNAHLYYKKIGVYWFVGGTTKNDLLTEINFLDTELRKQAKNNLYCTLPVFLDVELKTQYYSKNFANSLTYCLEILENLGYFAGLYTYKSFYDKVLNQNFNKRFFTWIADYRLKYQKSYFNSNFKALQYSSTGTVPGISGRVDLDYIFDDPSNTIINKKFNLIK